MNKFKIVLLTLCFTMLMGVMSFAYERPTTYDVDESLYKYNYVQESAEGYNFIVFSTQPFTVKPFGSSPKYIHTSGQWKYFKESTGEFLFTGQTSVINNAYHKIFYSNYNIIDETDNNSVFFFGSQSSTPGYPGGIIPDDTGEGGDNTSDWDFGNLFTNLANSFKETIQLLLSPINLIVEGIQTIIETIINIPKILSDIFNFIFDLPVTLFDMLVNLFKYLFIPQDNYFITQFDNIKLDLADKFNIDLNQLKLLADAKGEQINDINVNIMGVSGTVLKAQYINGVIGTIRGWVTGFVGFLLIVYNYNKLYFLIRGTYPIKMGFGQDSKEGATN